MELLQDVLAGPLEPVLEVAVPKERSEHRDVAAAVAPRGVVVRKAPGVQHEARRHAAAPQRLGHGAGLWAAAVAAAQAAADVEELRVDGLQTEAEQVNTMRKGRQGRLNGALKCRQRLGELQRGLLLLFLLFLLLQSLGLKPAAQPGAQLHLGTALLLLEELHLLTLCHAESSEALQEAVFRVLLAYEAECLRDSLY